MESITIPLFPVSMFDPDYTVAQKQYDAFQDEWCSKIENASGVRPRNVYQRHEYTWVDGVLYSRSTETRDKFFCATEESAKLTDAPEVMCRCGSVEFTLRYGSYEIKARCVKCGLEETVYDG